MNQKSILDHIDAYAATGYIDNALLPYFDQSGQWQGESIKWRIPTSKSSLQAIEKSHLPASRRMIPTDRGPVLQTSFYWQSTNPLTLIYHEIKGSVVVTQNVSVYAANLRHVGGDFIAKTSNHRIYLPRLQTVGGKIKVITDVLLRTPQLQKV